MLVFICVMSLSIMKTVKNIYLLVALIVVSGCATYTVDSDYDLNADFSSLKTFDWVSSTQPETGDPRIDNALLASKVRKAVNTTLASKGYQHKTTDSPDFLVQYHVAIEEKSDVTTVDTPHYAAGPTSVPGGFGSMGYSVGYRRAETYVTHYEEGTLLIDIVNPKSKKLIWHGSAKKVVDASASSEQRTTNINTAVQKILENFPPEKQ